MEMRNACIIVGKPDGKTPLVKLRQTWG